MSKDNDNTEGFQVMRKFQKDGKKENTKVKRLQPSTVMFVPNKRRRTLLKKMKDNEERLADMTGFKVNYTEAAGTKLGRVFSLDLAKNQPCGRNQEKCRNCSPPEEVMDNCKSRCITYESRCILCNPEKQNKQDLSTPQEEEVHHHPHQEGEAGVMADPSFRRVGIYIE